MTLRSVFFVPLSILLLLTLLLVGCSPMQNMHGNFADPYVLNQLKVGTATKQQVKAALGAPSSTSTFDRNIWFYIGQRTAQYAFLRPKVVAHKVVALSFNDQNTLDAMVVRGLDEYTPIEPIRRSTPSAGKKLSVLEQLVGNVGKYNKK